MGVFYPTVSEQQKLRISYNRDQYISYKTITKDIHPINLINEPAWENDYLPVDITQIGKWNIM